MKLSTFCILFVAAPVLFAAARDDGPVAFSLVEHCKQYFKCEAREQHCAAAPFPATFLS
jgi:hypothetical protein